jgi:hypothetical protein
MAVFLENSALLWSKWRGTYVSVGNAAKAFADTKLHLFKK